MKTIAKILIFVFLFTGGFRIDYVNAAALELIDTPLFSDANLTAYYQLEDATDSKASFDLTNENSVTFGAGKFNNGAIFASSGQTLTRNDTAGVADTDNWTISFWVKLNTEVSDAYDFSTFFTGTNTNLIRYKNDGGTRVLQVFSGNWEGGTIGNLTMGTTNWFHFAVTRNDGTGEVIVYVDGSAFGSPFTATGSDSVSPYMKIGSNSGSLNTVGVIDDFAIFNRILTPTEISNLFTGNFPAGDTCTYGGTGNWDILYSDNCYITSAVYVNGEFNLIASSTGSFGTEVEISATRINIGNSEQVIINCKNGITCLSGH